MADTGNAHEIVGLPQYKQVPAKDTGADDHGSASSNDSRHDKKEYDNVGPIDDNNGEQDNVDEESGPPVKVSGPKDTNNNHSYALKSIIDNEDDAEEVAWSKEQEEATSVTQNTNNDTEWITPKYNLQS